MVGKRNKPRRWHGKYTPAGWNKGLQGDPRCIGGVAVLKRWRITNPGNYLCACSKGGKLGGVRGGGTYSPKSGRSKGSYRIDSNGKTVWLQSSYELKCQEILDSQGIRWVRPPSIKYLLGGKSKRYYPDFLLLDYGLYLDPKNEYLAKLEEMKFEALKVQTGLRIVVLKLDQITSEFIKSCCGIG